MVHAKHIVMCILLVSLGGCASQSGGGGAPVSETWTYMAQTVQEQEPNDQTPMKSYSDRLRETLDEWSKKGWQLVAVYEHQNRPKLAAQIGQREQPAFSQETVLIFGRRN